MFQEAAGGTINDSQDALISLIFKSGNFLEGTITDGVDPIPNVTVDAGALGSVLTDANGDYQIPGILDASAYTVTPTLVGYTFVPSDAMGLFTNLDITENFTGSIQTFTISGTILEDGAPLEGVTVDGGAIGSVMTDAAGFYSFTNIPYNTSYQLIYSSTGCTFAPTSSGMQTLTSNAMHDSSATCVDPDEDSDGDGLADLVEDFLGTSSCDSDSDGDGLSDSNELLVYKTEYLDADSDDDGLSDGDEVALGLDPLDTDSDGDGIQDGTESGVASAIAAGITPLLTAAIFRNRYHSLCSR